MLLKFLMIVLFVLSMSIEHIVLLNQLRVCNLAVFWSCKCMCIITYVIVDLSNLGVKGNWRSNSV